jgi:hypothetical protein
MQAIQDVCYADLEQQRTCLMITSQTYQLNESEFRMHRDG